MVKYKFSDLDKIRDEGRCGAIYFYCVNEDCNHIFDKEDRTTSTCPSCGTDRKVCGKYNIKGRNRCSIHGGKTPMGILSPNYKGRGSSVNLPTRLFEYYQMSVRDEEERGIDMVEDIHLLETRKTQLKAQLSEEGADQLWQKARKAFEKFSTARKKAARGNAKAPDQMADALDELELILVKGNTQGYIWDQLLEIVQVQMKVKESELKRREKAAEIVTAEQVATMLGKILAIINDRVKDQEVRKAIINDIQSMIGVM